MTANVIVTVERRFDHPRDVLFRAWTDPTQLAQWRGSPGWRVEDSSGDRKPGGRHHHVKVKDDGTRVTTDGIYSEYFPPDVFVSRERITGDPEIDPDSPLELRVEFTQYGEGTLVRVIQGPYEPEIAEWHGQAWEKELDRLDGFLPGGRREAGR